MTSESINLFNAVVLTLTLVVIAFYTYETTKLRRIAELNFRNSARPLIILEGDGITIKNVGLGPAINICPIVWTGSSAKVVPHNAVPQVLVMQGAFKLPQLVDADFSNIRKSFPEACSLLNEISDLQHPFVLTLYSDIFDATYYSLLSSENGGYRQATRIGAFGVKNKISSRLLSGLTQFRQ